MLVALGKTVALHEATLQSKAREENIVLRGSSDHSVMVGLDASVEAYAAAGKKALAESKTSGNTFYGNPYGKKTNAFFSAILVRLLPILQLLASPGALIGFTGNDLMYIQNAIETLTAASSSASATVYVVSRCFVIHCKSGPGGQELCK